MSSKEIQNPTIGSPQGSAFSNQNKVILLQARNSRQLFRLNKDRIVIGSVESADVLLKGEGIAPIHAVLELVRSGHVVTPTIYDLASETGVFINSEKVITRALKDGDQLRIGHHVLSFTMDDVSREQPAAAKYEESEGRKLFLNPEEDLSPLLLQENYDVQQIFDYRPTTKKALQIVMSWRGTVLNVEHFVDQKMIRIGTSQNCDFAIPALLDWEEFPFVTQSASGFVLHIDRRMTGVVQRKGALSPLDELQGMASEHGYAVSIEQEDFAKICLDEIDFYLNFTPAPPRLKPSRMLERDPLLIKIFSASLVLTAATIMAIAKIHVPQNLDAEQIPDRIATILYQTQKYTYQADKTKVSNVDESEVKKQETQKTQPAPRATLELHPNQNSALKPIPKEFQAAVEQKKSQGFSKASRSAKGGAQSQSEAKEGQGARAKGTEGKHGSQVSRVRGQTAQTQAMRPSPNGGEGRGSGNSQVQDEGNVDVLKGMTSKIENILGNSGAALGKGGEKLKGFGGFNTVGNGGLALSGTGKGGGGDANTTLGGLSSKGRAGGRVGTGMGAAGSGSGIVGGQSRMVIRSGGPEEAVVMGSIDADAVEAALLRHKDEFRLCYEREINAENPNLAGRVGTTFVIGSSGRVDQAGIESSTLNNSNAERCIVQVIKRIEFPIPRGAGTVQVSYPFKFSPVGRT